MPDSSSDAAVHPEVAGIRSLALVGQTASGKTSLAEALLHRAGVIGTPGSLERGTTVCDFDPMERRVQHSLNAAIVQFEHEGTRVHMIDTPGYADFVGQAMTALEAVDCAAVLVEPEAGIQPLSVQMMESARQRGLCRLIVVNKIDQQDADLAGLLEQLQATFGKECLPLNLPSADRSRVLDCFFAAAAPEGASAAFSSVEQAHRALVEQVVEVDANFVERYLNEGDVDPRELHAPLEQALREGHLIPVCFVSARSGAGVGELLDVIERLLERRVQLARVDVALVEVALDEGGVHFHHLLHQRAVRLLHRGEVGRRALVLHLPEAVQHRFAPLRGQVDRQAFAAERGLDLLHQRFQVDALRIDLVDDDDAVAFALRGPLHHAHRHRLDAGRCVDDDGGGLDGLQGRQRLPEEIRRTRGVDQVREDVAVFEVQQRRVEGTQGPLFQRVVVRDGTAPLDAAGCAHRPGLPQQGFGQAGLACGTGPDEGHGAARGDVAIGCHERNLPWGIVVMRGILRTPCGRRNVLNSTFGRVVRCRILSERRHS